MKRPGILACTVFALLTSPVLAQEDMDTQMGPPQPAKELEKLQRLIGYWEGEGTSRMAPGAPEEKWTSSSHVRKVLGGHFLREDMRIESDAWKAPLQFISFYGYDKHAKRHIGLGISNTGKADRKEITFLDDDTMIQMENKLHQGKPVVGRWITRIGDDGSLSYLGEEAIGDGEWFVHVKGTARKVEDKPKGDIVNAAHSFMERTGGDKMGKLKGMAGTWKFTGKMLAIPGAPMMQISGECITEAIFGGTVLQTVVHGDPTNGQAYKGWHAMVWDATEKHYVSMGVNNMGEAAIEKAVWASDTELLFTNTGPWYGGIPSVSSGVMKCAEDGAVESYTMHSIIGTNKPMKTFHIEYTRK